MPRDEPLADPTVESVRAAATAALGRPVARVTPIERGVNALYRIDPEGGDPAVLKAPTYATDDAFLAEPALLSRIEAETAVPVPPVRATVEAQNGPLDRAYYLTTFLEGRTVDSATAVRPANRDRLVREAAAHLAAIQTIRVGEAYGHLQAPDGCLAVASPRASWAALFDRLVEDVTAGLLGDGVLADTDPRFADLEPEVRDALGGADPVADHPTPAPAVVTRDYRVGNLVLAPPDSAGPLVQGVLDVGGLVGDGLLDVALTEEALIDGPLGGTDGAERLRRAFRTTYAERRGVEPSRLFDERYPCYRLYARADTLAAFDYAVQFAREPDPDAVAQRWRSFVDARLAEIRDGYPSSSRGP